MPLRIIHRTTPIEVSQVVIAVMGQPGLGKTSLGFTADAPLLLDFDAGAYRSAFRQDSVPVGAWEEVATLSAADLEPYRTIVADTAGRALDKITEHIAREQPKLVQSSGALTLKGYGELKAIFTGWVRRLRELGKDIVILAHDAEEKNGDDVIVRPDIQGGSRHEIPKVADAMAYLYLRGKDRILDFNPSDRWQAKNCAGLPPLPVPSFHDDPAFLAGIIARIKASLNRQSEEQLRAGAEMAALRERIVAAASAEDFNALIPVAQSADPGIRDAVKRMLMAAAGDKRMTFNRESGAFTAAA